MRLPTHLITSVLLLAFGSHVATVSAQEVELRQLTEDNFRASTARGMWLVEHYSPKCSHCRAFAPTWAQLAKDKQHLERLSGFHMAQVNCLAQGDLCNTNGIKFYPQILLYSDGHSTPYSGDRSLADLSRFIDEQSSTYARALLPNAPSQAQEVVASGFHRPNPEGQVAEVDEVELERLIAEGPVLADFYAPWCGHCKKLRPTYEQVAEGLKGKLNVVGVNCDAHRRLCKKYEVQGYPTIKLFNEGQVQEFSGARNLDKLNRFAAKALGPRGMQSIKYEDFADIVKNEEAFFLYLQNFDTSVADLDTVKKTLESLPIPAFTSADPLLYANLSIANPVPTSLLLAFSSYTNVPLGSLAFPTSTEALQKFVKVHRYPTLTKLHSGNYNRIMKADSKPIIVLGALHKGEEGKKDRMAFNSVAKAWKRGGRDFEQPVWFVWVEGDKWASWLKQSYGIKKSQLPAVVVIDPALNEYYDTTIEGNKIAFDGASIFSVLEGVYQHFLRPKRSETTLEWGSRSATMTLITTGQWVMDHSLLALVSVTGGVAIFVYLLQRCIPRDPREPGANGQPRGRGNSFVGMGMSEKGRNGNRLD